MGFKQCQFCGNSLGSYDVEFTLENGVTYKIPQLIVHFIEEHSYCPPIDFCHDILTNSVTRYCFQQTKGINLNCIDVGYLPGDYPTPVSEVPQGDLPEGALNRVKEIIAEAKRRFSNPG